VAQPGNDRWQEDSTVQAQVSHLLAISVNRKQISVYLSLMASTVVVADGKYSCRCSDDNSNE
jgi:hypothetical protein